MRLPKGITPEADLEYREQVSLDSMFGIYPEWIYLLQEYGWQVPRSQADKRKLGTTWHIEDGRKVQITIGFGGYRKSNSVTICENRNHRRQSFGYKDTYSMRERGWPTGQKRRPRKAKPEPIDFQI